MADRLAKPLAGSPRLRMALLAALCHGTAHSALPPATGGTSAQNSDAAAADATTGSDNVQEGASWRLPPIRIGGVLTYGIRRDSFEEQQRMQTGLTATLNGRTNTFIWQPWFAQVTGGLGLSLSRDSSGGNQESSKSQSVFVTGSGQLSLLPLSQFPFEAHFQRNDSRVSSDLSLANGYASQRYGFVQRYFRPEGESMLSWDRDTQTSVDTGSDRQDSLQLRIAHRLEKHRLQLVGNRSTNTHERTDEHVVQNNLSLQHSYAPGPSISLESMANVSRSKYQLQQGDNDSLLLQLSSNAFWRPTDQVMTVNGGVRVFALDTNSTGLLANSNGARVLNTNANVGVNYEFNRFTRINAGANVNMSDSNGEKSTNTNQTLGATYQPDSIELGSFRYNWSTSGNATNRTGEQDAGVQLTLQLSHSLSRSIRLTGGSTVAMDASQSVAVSTDTSSAGSEAQSTKQLTHNGSISWDLSQESGAALVRLSASDSRALDGKKEFFQLINFQASSNLPTGQYSSWSGNLTVQAVRQGSNPLIGNANLLNTQASTQTNGGFLTSSSGSISYQNQRLLGVRRLRFVSDLRLNGQSLLPIFSSAKEQETAAWENRVDYSIGRTQLRLNVMISRSGALQSSADPAAGAQTVTKVNKSIMFSVSRSFGNN